MATVIRESGAWKDVLGTLHRYDIRAGVISDLPTLLSEQKNAYVKTAENFEKENQILQEQYKRAVDDLTIKWETSVQIIKEKFDSAIEKIDRELECVQGQALEMKKSSILSKLFHLGTIVSLSREESHLRVKRQKLHNTLKKELELLKKSHNDKVQKFAQKNAEYQFEIKKKNRIAQERVCILDETLRSGPYFGAIAELKMIDLLRKLPENYYVINDVKLRLNKGLRFDGKWLESSQIDHLVVGPAGVFVIEVKNWSENFSSVGDFFDPYQQIKRHNYVCYSLLKRRFETCVRNIIACAGHIPTKPADSYAKVLPIEQVNNYILWFKDIKHDKETIQKIVHFIESEIRY